MRALLFLGVLLGAGYTAALWLLIAHYTGKPSPWNLLFAPAVIGGVGFLLLFAWTMLDALTGGMD